MLRITVGDERILVVGDATLASAEHHHKDPKPRTVEKYRRTLGWSIDGGIIRCHPMGDFVISLRLQNPGKSSRYFLGLRTA